MRILILGKNGMLGSDLQKVFAREDFLALGQNDLDITRRDDVFEQLITIQPDVVINATGYTAVDLAETDEQTATKINGSAVGILAQACREIDATLVHFSSDYVFQGDQKHGYKEEDQTHPLNAYGRSKELGEKLLIEEMEMQRSEMEKEGKYFLIRTSWLYGHHGKNFVDTMLKMGRAEAEKGCVQDLKVVNDQHGKPTWTMDLAAQVKFLLESREYPSGIYHITNEQETTWFEFAQTIFALADVPVHVIPCTSQEYARPAKRPEYSNLLNTKLPPLRSWKEALKDYLSA